MKKEELIIGNKYVPLKKSIGVRFNSSQAWINAQEMGQNFLYLSRIDEIRVLLTETMGYTCDYFLPEDIIPYEEIPEKWCIKITPENREFLKNTDDILFEKGYNYTMGGYYWNKRGSRSTEDRTEITFEQFQTHILKQNMKKIIGYKLSGVATAQEVARLLNCDDYIDNQGLFFTAAQAVSPSGQKAKDLKVFDIWFTPVYEDDKVMIGTYEATKDGFNVVVGCQTYNKETLLVIQSLLGRGTKHEIKVEGINITLEDINKLLALLNT